VDEQSEKLQKIQPAPIEDIQALDRVPADTTTYAALTKFWKPQIRLWVEARLGPSDCALLKQHAKNLGILPHDVILRCWAALDDVIFEQARIIGWRIFLFPDFVNRVVRWEKEPKGAEQSERLGKEVALGIAVSQGRKNMPLNSKMRVLRKELIPEVKMLRDRLKSKVMQRALLDPEKLLGMAIALAGDPSEPFERLRANTTSLKAFIQEKSAADEQWLCNLVYHEVTPTVFVDEWLAQATNRDPEALRQAISRMADAPDAR
jgi:hypothetical protein